MHRSLSLTLIAVVCFCAFGTVGQVNPGRVHAAAQHAPVTVRVGYIPIVDFLPLYTAVERGYFRSQGLNLVLTPVNGGPTTMAALEGGSLDVGVSASLGAILAASHGLQPVFVTHANFEDRAHPAHSILVMKDSPIRRGKDFKGKRVAVNGLKSIEELGMDRWLQHHGANPAQTQFTELPFANMVAALTHGQVDAALTAEPGTTIGLSQGARIVGHHYADERPRTFLGGLIALRPWAASHSGVVRRFAAAYTQGALWASRHSVAARTRYLPSYTHLSVALARQIKVSAAVRKLAPADLQYWVQMGIRWHVLTKRVNVSRLLWTTATH